MSRLLVEAIRDTWGSPILVGLPKRSCFEHGTTNYTAWASLRTSDVVTTWELKPGPALEAPSLAAYIDHELHELREDHARALGWHIGLAGYKGRPDLS